MFSGGGGEFEILLLEVRVFFVEAREERTAVFFVTDCALLLLFIEAGLFAFFDGDTDDLHCRGVAVIGVARRNGHQHIQPLNDLTEYRMLVIQMRSGFVCDKEL